MNEHEDATAGATMRDEGRGVLLLRAGGLAFAVYADECECVTPWTEPTPLPHAPPSVLGVVSVRGRMRTVLDPARLFEPPGLKHERRPAQPRLIASLVGDEQLALAAETSDPVTLPLGEEAPPPDLPALHLRATFLRGGETVYLLAPSRLFEAAMRGTERRRRRY